MESHRTPEARIEAIVRGRVQGVGFRWSTQRVAERRGLGGTVRNTIDGSVAVTAEGSRDELEALVAWLANGPPAARVTACDVTWLEAAGAYRRFDVVG